MSSMKLSINNLELFNKLSDWVDFPKEFIQLFLKKCMHQCMALNNMKGAKEISNTQKRAVRIVSVFL